MKVHMFTLAALAATSLSAQGVAQQQGEESLERALADLNEGLITAQSASVDIVGDARLRNLYVSGGDSKTIDGRYRVGFSFNVNEQVGGFMQILGFESWGSQIVDGVVAEDPTRIDTRIDQAYFYANDLFGDGGTFTLGRKYYTLGSGRILGSDDWDQAPAIYTGLWYNHEAGGANIELFFMNSQHDDEAAASIGGTPPAYDDMFGVTFDWVFETESSAGDIEFSPYLLSNRDNGISLEDGFYLGTTVAGELMGFGWDFEFATQDEGGDAFALSTTIGIDALESIPGVNDGGLTIQITGSDDDFSPVANAAGAGGIRHAVAGIRDFLGNGIWTSDTDTVSAHLDFAPGETWNGKLSYWGIDTGMIDYTEFDLQVGTTLVGAVDLWLGYAHTSSDDAGGPDDDIIWAVVGTAF